jgi:hypothetical protein
MKFKTIIYKIYNFVQKHLMIEVRIFFMINLKSWNLEYWNLEYWNLEILNLKILKSWILTWILKYWILKYWILKYWNLEILNFEILNIEILKFWNPFMKWNKIALKKFSFSVALNKTVRFFKPLIYCYAIYIWFNF